MGRKTVTLLLVVLWIALWLSVPVVQARKLVQPRAALQELLDLSLWVARVAANEGALKRRNEAALVWQTTRSSGKNTAKRAEWLARHSPRVHGTRPCRTGNCFWTPNLTRDAAFPLGILLGPKPVEVWDIKVSPLWRDTLAYVDWMVLGDRKSEDPCHVTPVTWGCERDRKGALERGLHPIGCRGTIDDGFTYAKHCWGGTQGWVCDKRFEISIESEGSTQLLSGFAFAY